MALDYQELIRRSQEGDVEAFEELILAHQQKIYSIAYRMMGNPYDASDMAQEALVKIFKFIKNYRGEASFSTWIYHITMNTCRDELRKKYWQIETSLDQPMDNEEGSFNREIADFSSLPEDIYEKKELGAYLQGLIQALHPEYRMVIVMRENMGLSYEEIAEQLNISLGTVKSRLNRARKCLRDKILADKELYPQLQRLKL